MHYYNSNCDHEERIKSDGPGKRAVQITMERLFNASLISENDESWGRPASGEFFDLQLWIPGIGARKFEAEYAARFAYIDEPTVNVPYRKHEGKNSAHVFCTVDKLENSWVWLCCRDHVHRSPVINRRTKRGKVESFFSVPWELGYLTAKKDGEWTRLFRWSKRETLGL